MSDEIIQGRIEDLRVTSGEKNGKAWKRGEFTIDGKKYSTFDNTIFETFKVGMTVEMAGNQSGKYWNMTGMREMSDPNHCPPVEVVKPGAKPVPISEPADKQMQIARMSALKTVAESQGVLTSEQMIAEAKKLVNYIITGQ